MAGIDKTYCNTVAEYEEFKQWAIEEQDKFKNYIINQLSK